VRAHAVRKPITRHFDKPLLQSVGIMQLTTRIFDYGRELVFSNRRMRKMRGIFIKLGHLHVRKLWHAPLQRNGCSLFEAHALLAEADSAPFVVTRTAVPDLTDRQPSVFQTHITMSRRRANRNRPDRRKDRVTADLVDIGLLFADVFGMDRGESYFCCTAVPSNTYRRVLLGPRRDPMPRDSAGDPAPAE
jgi:hypothetical protein